MTNIKMNVQSAPYPDELERLVNGLELHDRTGWKVFLQDDFARDYDTNRNVIGKGLTLTIQTLTINTYHPERGRNYVVFHFFIVPAATYNMESWRRWLFDCIHKVDLHELMEGFVIDGERPFAPNHGAGCDPYIIHEPSNEEDRATRFDDHYKVSKPIDLGDDPDGDCEGNL